MAYPVYYLQCDPALRTKQIEITRTQVGTRETGNNRGAVEKYCRSSGIPLGSPYCASGIYWSFDTAAHSLGYTSSYIPLPKTGLANGMYVYAAKKGTQVAGSYRAGDLIVWRNGSTVFGHIGQIVQRLKAGWIRTIEYNTGSPAEREGDGVYCKLRNVLHPLGRMRTRGFITFRK